MSTEATAPVTTAFKQEKDTIKGAIANGYKVECEKEFGFKRRIMIFSNLRVYHFQSIGTAGWSFDGVFKMENGKWMRRDGARNHFDKLTEKVRVEETPDQGSKDEEETPEEESSEEPTPCPKCQGNGKLSFSRDGGICYQCNGDGYFGDPEKVREYREAKESRYALNKLSFDLMKGFLHVAEKKGRMGKDDFPLFKAHISEESEKSKQLDQSVESYFGDLFDLLQKGRISDSIKMSENDWIKRHFSYGVLADFDVQRLLDWHPFEDGSLIPRGEKLGRVRIEYRGKEGKIVPILYAEKPSE